MREFPEKRAEVIKEYERLHQLFANDRLEFESEIKRAVENIISKAKNEIRKNNLKKLQKRLDDTLINKRKEVRPN